MAPSRTSRAAKEGEIMSVKAREVAERVGVFLGIFRRGLGDVNLRAVVGWRWIQVGKSNMEGNTYGPRYKHNFKRRSLMLPLPMLRDWKFTTQ